VERELGLINYIGEENSMLDSILQPFIDIRNDPYDWIGKWKENNKDKKVVAVGVYHFPEEIVHAAGILPFGLQEGSEPIVDGYSYIYPSYCGYSRSLIDMGAKGKMKMFDGVVITDICVQLVQAHRKFFRNFPQPHLYLHQPSLDLTKERNKRDLTVDYDKLRAQMSDIVGHPIEDAAITNSIKVYNKNRALLRKIHDMRHANPGLIKARDMQAVVMSSMVMLKEENNEMLLRLIDELEKAEPAKLEGVPVFLSGHLCHAPKIEILDMIEEMGGIVVDDDLHTGYRYYAKDARTDGNPIEALIDRFRQIEPDCVSRIHPENRWDEYLLRKAEQSGAKGVIILQPKYCEHQNFAYVYQHKTLAEGGMDHILIESEHEIISFEQIRTKIQAFVEMIQAKATEKKGR
jgi:bcr-type benzoyl-CoA reductase subunit C